MFQSLPPIRTGFTLEHSYLSGDEFDLQTLNEVNSINQATGWIPFVMRCLLSALLPFFLSASTLFGQDQNGSPRYLILHLDGVSSLYLNLEWDADRLPHLKRTFQDHAVLDQTVTYLPSKTPTVISSLREGIPLEESRAVSWAGRNRETDQDFSGVGTFRQMALSTSRLAVSNLIYGIPGLDLLAGMAISNVPELIEEYQVLEFYWYAVDTFGHFFGEEAYLKKLRKFDSEFGKMVSRLDKDVNIIIYADHGMSFKEGVDTNQEVLSVAGEETSTVSYPHVYLHHAEDAEEIAERLVNETRIGFTFVQTDRNQVKGYHQNGVVYIDRFETGYSYRYEGTDPFGYFDSGYRGETWSADEWLVQTAESTYPAAPVNLFNLMSNPGAGEVLTFLKDNLFSKTLYSRRGNHGGMTSRDVTVPVLLRGKQVEDLYDRNTLWLQDLFLEISDIPFRNTPSRDDHEIGWEYDISRNHHIARLNLSLLYRWSVGSELVTGSTSGQQHIRTWTEFDLYRSYLTRVWVGGGTEISGGELRPMAFIRHEFQYQKLGARTTFSTTGRIQFQLELRPVRTFSLLAGTHSAGIRLHL